MKYIVCERCKRRIEVPICPEEAPILFIVTCPHCNSRFGASSYDIVFEANECNPALRREIFDILGRCLWIIIYFRSMTELTQLLAEAKEALEKAKA
jgi:hypothetical protein